MTTNCPGIPFERYADDVVCHCRSEAAARSLQARFAECQLELNPQKTKIVYCKDDNRRGNFRTRQFNFLGYSFQPRRAKNRRGELFVSFGPAVSGEAAKAMRKKMRRWKLHHRSDLALEEIAKWTRPTLLGWVRYYGRFRPSALHAALHTLDQFLVRWARRKYRKLRAHTGRAWDWLETLFPHWGALPTAGR
jgi:RNA-directed DNA polymerase